MRTKAIFELESPNSSTDNVSLLEQVIDEILVFGLLKYSIDYSFQLAVKQVALLMLHHQIKQSVKHWEMGGRYYSSF